VSLLSPRPGCGPLWLSEIPTHRRIPDSTLVILVLTVLQNRVLKVLNVLQLPVVLVLVVLQLRCPKTPKIVLKSIRLSTIQISHFK
jgi:hypothetical protein